MQETNIIQKTITVHNNKEKNYIKDNYEILYYSTDDEEFTNLIQEYNEGKMTKIVVTKIEAIEDKEGNSNLYKLDVEFQDNADSEKNQNVDFYSLVVTEGTNYDIKVLKIKEVSLCNTEFKFNFTVDDNIKGNDAKITLTLKLDFSRFSFRGNYSSSSGTNYTSNTPYPKADCTLSSKYKNIIPCLLNRETTANINFSIFNYFSMDENQMISISADSNFYFPLYCHENSPIAAIIFISSMFLFIVIVVIVIIILMNKKGRGERGYEAPNNSNNNMIGMSSGNLSK